jgi:hypothetical protein
MKKLLYPIFFSAILFFSASCIQTGDEERPGMAVSKDFLLTKVWEVEIFHDDGQDKSSLFNNVFLEFRPGQVFRITHGCDVIDGEWILSQDSTLLVIRIPDSPEPFSQLEDEWVITWLTDSEMHLIEQDNKGDEEFHLKITPLQSLNCTTCLELSQKLAENLWSITEFKTTDHEYTEASRGAYLEFNLNGEVKLYSGDDEITGSWVLTAQCNTLVIKWFDENIHSDHYKALQDYWYIHHIYSNSISLESEDGSLEVTKGKIPDCVELHSQMSNTSWSIDYLSINGDNVSENFLGTGLTFLENNQLATDVIVGPAVLGDWILSGNCDILAIQIQAGQLKELSKEWIITEIKPEQIFMLYEEGTLSMEMVLKRGKPHPTPNCLESVGIISDRKWSLAKFSENGYHDADYLYGYYLKFTDDGALLISNDSQEIMGTWYPVRDCKNMVIELDREGAAGKLVGKWKIQTLESSKFVMVYEKMGMKRTIEMVSS